MKNLRRLFLAFGLALALALGQQGAALHALGHAADELAQQDSTPAPSKCADHSLFASLAGAVGAEPPVAPFMATAALVQRADPQPLAWLPSRYSYLSRAPPASPA